MSPGAVEIAIFPSNEAYRKDPSIVHPVLDFAAGAKGSLGIYHGLQIEDGKTGYLVVVWETVEDHKNLLNSGIYDELVERVKACVDGWVDMFHVNFEPSTAAILNGPVTSLGLITKLKPGKTGDHVAANMTTLTGAKNVNGCTGTAFGKIVENDQFAFMTGWNTIEDHTKAREEHPTIVDFPGQIKETAAEWNVKHVALTSYRKTIE